MSKSQDSPTSAITKDSFQLKEIIGEGQFGKVYRAVDKSTNTEFALKQISKFKIFDSHLYCQLKREVEIQSRLKHKNICQLYTYYQEGDHIYIVLEYCRHGTLAEIKERKEHFSDKKIASFFQQLVYAVAYMHERHVMHRDLKLQNILLDGDYNLKISDFGCCRHNLRSNPNNRRRTFCGTMEYISPEMLHERPYTDSVDTYCIGIILYELFYFTSPFLGADEQQTFHNIKERAVSFRDDIRVIPDEAKSLIRRLIAKDPRERPMTKDLFEDVFVKKYLYGSEEDKVFGRRYTEESFIKWQQEVGVSHNNEATKTESGPGEEVSKTEHGNKEDKEGEQPREDENARQEEESKGQDKKVEPSSQSVPLEERRVAGKEDE